MAFSGLPEFGSLGMLNYVCSASVLLLNCVSQWRFLEAIQQKPTLSAKSLLGLHNHGTVSFSFSQKKKKNFLLPFPLFEIVSLHVN